MNLETTQVNLPTVFTIVLSTFGLYFFVGSLISAALVDAKIYTIDMDIERDQDVIEMYRFQITNGIAKEDAPNRIASLEAKIQRRIRERTDLQAEQ